MPSEMVCVRCGRPVDAGVTIPLGTPVGKLCEGCAGWQRAHASDQEDHDNSTGLGAMRSASHPNDTVPHF